MLTPFKSFLPFAGKMLTYLEAIRNPRKHMVKTFAMGKTAILMVPNKDCPPRWGSIRICVRTLWTLSILASKTLTGQGIFFK